jgi:hypothetical protein
MRAGFIEMRMAKGRSFVEDRREVEILIEQTRKRRNGYSSS